MNILPKKSWHVRTKANIERVRRDEAKAAAEEKDKQERIAIAEQEARTSVLRQRAEERALASGEPTGSSKQVVVSQESKHINFWSDLEQGKTTSGGNAEYAKEKKDEKEKQEKDIGLLTYLGQSAAETQSTKPWYHLPRDKRESQEERDKPGHKKKEEEFDRKRKHASDPMNHMNTYLEKKRKHDEGTCPKDKHKEKKHKRHKHKDEHRVSRKKSGAKTVEQLRAERLARERSERQRTEALMAKLRGEKPEKKPEEDLDDRSRGYNSQFNPELARKRKPRQSYP